MRADVRAQDERTDAPEAGGETALIDAIGAIDAIDATDTTDTLETR